MAFSTVTFLFCFLPAALILYRIAASTNNIRLKNITLLVLSLVFYAWCGLQYLILLAALLIINYLLSKKVQTNKRQFFIAVVMNIVILGFFKYFNFFGTNIEAVARLLGYDTFSLNAPIIPLPLGISFFVFQIISFLADRHRGKIGDDVTFTEFSLYITMFPQLIEGPIVRYSEVSAQMRERSVNTNDLEEGTQRFIIGFAKKVLIANAMTPIVDQAFSMPGILPLGYAWLGAICYAFEIYFDFSGYSDMAIGLCRIFGFKINENFDLPYISASIQEFWRRWHISLSTWFRDYVYIPLGGNRKGTFHTYRNLITIFFLTGLWHGASWNFIVWGLFHGFFMLLERMGLKKQLEKLPQFVGHLYAIVVVLVGWVFFRAESLTQAVQYITAMFIPNGATYGNYTMFTLIANSKFAFTFLLATICSVGMQQRIMKALFTKEHPLLRKTALVILFVVSAAFMVGSGFNPSIYTKF